MVRSHPQDETGQSGPIGLFSDTRGVADQIDQLNAAIFMVIGVTITITLSFGLVAGAGSGGVSQDYAAERAAGSLSADILRGTDPSASLLNETCTESYFSAQGPASCGYDTYPTSSERAYLASSLGINQSHAVNVTVLLRGGVVNADLDGDGTSTRLTIGPDTPVTGDAATFNRRVAFAEGGEYYTLRVTVWEEP